MRTSCSQVAALTLALLVLPERDAEAGDLDVLLFESLDAGRSAFSTSGAKIGLGPLDREGAIALVSIGDGVRSDRVRCGCGAIGNVPRFSADASVLAGWQWTLPEGIVATFAGVETSYDSSRGTRNGVRMQVEAWLRPSDVTLVHAVSIAGTARGSLWMRVAWGYQLWDTYLGPEGSFYLDGTGYGKAAFGLHATDFVLLNIHVRLSTGLQWETGRTRLTPYVTLATWAPF